MIDGLKPYPSMKDSGVEWVGEVPEHWTLTSNRSMLRRRKVLVGNRYTNYNLLSLTKAGVVIRDVSTGRGKFSADMGTSQEVRSGDLVFCLFDVPETPRTVGLSRHNGMITGAYSVFECDDCLLGRFLETFYIAMDNRKALSPLYVGLRNTIPHSRLLGTKTPIPPEDEQTAIVRFLDHIDRRTRRYIHAKQKLIALLVEQKQAITHQAATGQIDVRTGRPYPAYKDSGVDWLGDVPVHWEVRRSKRTFTPRQELASSKDVQLSATQAYGVIAQKDYEKRVGRKVVKILRHLEQRRHVEVDDFVISMRSFQGGLERAWQSGCIRSSYIVLQAATEVVVGYFGQLFKSVGYIAALQSTANFIRDGQDLNFENFCRVDLPFPPKQEQQLVAATLERVTMGIGLAIERSSREIDLLREYRTRLISDVVTGKVDVREAAARLPDVDPLSEEDVDDPAHADAGSNLDVDEAAQEVNL